MKMCQECGNELDYCKSCSTFHCCANDASANDEKRMARLREEFGKYIDFTGHGSGTADFSKMRESAIAWQNYLYGVSGR